VHQLGIVTRPAERRSDGRRTLVLYIFRQLFSANIDIGKRPQLNGYDVNFLSLIVL